MPQFTNGRTDRLFECLILLEIFLNQVGDDLGIGFSDESMIRFSETLFQLQVILDDAVMHPTTRAGSRDAVRFSSVGRPCVATRVANSISAID
jgi:hypothetical protein